MAEKNYEKDNSEKGKELSEKYAEAYNEAGLKYENFFQAHEKGAYLIKAENVKDRELFENLVEISILTDMERGRFAGSSSKVKGTYKLPEEVTGRIEKEDNRKQVK